jgi:hypothetical protein
MDRDLEKGKKQEDMDPIMMDEEQTMEIIRKSVVLCNERPYQYKINKKKRAIVE